MPLSILALPGRAYIARMSSRPDWVHGEPYDRAVTITISGDAATIHGLTDGAKGLLRYSEALNAWLAERGVATWGWVRGDGRVVNFRVRT